MNNVFSLPKRVQRTDEAKVGYDGEVLPVYFVCKGNMHYARAYVPAAKGMIYLVPKATRYEGHFCPTKECHLSTPQKDCPRCKEIR